MLGRIREVLTLRARRAAAARMAGDVRARLGRQIELAGQRGEAGESLWTHGHTAEGLRLVALGFEDALRAAEALRTVSHPAAPPAAVDDVPVSPAASEPAAQVSEPTSSPEPADLQAFLRRQGLSRRALRTVLAARDLAAARHWPELDAEVGASWTVRYRTLSAGRTRLLRVLRPPSMTPSELRCALVGRWLGLALAVLLLCVLAWWIVRTPVIVEATASAHLGQAAEYGSARAIDGDAETRWLLPDRSEGWLEVRLSPPRPVRTVRLLNTSNPPWHDRATRAYRLEVFAPDGETVHASEGEFESLDVHPDWVEVSMNVPEASRIRFTVKSHHRRGAGLAEMEWAP